MSSPAAATTRTPFQSSLAAASKARRASSKLCSSRAKRRRLPPSSPPHPTPATPLRGSALAASLVTPSPSSAAASLAESLSLQRSLVSSPSLAATAGRVPSLLSQLPSPAPSLSEIPQDLSTLLSLPGVLLSPQLPALVDSALSLSRTSPQAAAWAASALNSALLKSNPPTHPEIDELLALSGVYDPAALHRHIQKAALAAIEGLGGGEAAKAAHAVLALLPPEEPGGEAGAEEDEDQPHFRIHREFVAQLEEQRK
ncbi:hypothetical protein TeGR_g9882 [Tetraparma gracilis]|uniref:Uncharacterized protein n=1 Tax=Tetraparma gracilis TaxID=2962635 RepID=A0ABQ6M6R0_9STRA|nr:hypothetical protein TeGR_g9882 [Tetraparma gracilis]